MTRFTPNLKPTAAWQHATPTDRWQALNSALSSSTTTAASTWARRSPVICKRRALPAGVSALSPVAMA